MSPFARRKRSSASVILSARAVVDTSTHANTHAHASASARARRDARRTPDISGAFYRERASAAHRQKLAAVRKRSCGVLPNGTGAGALGRGGGVLGDEMRGAG